MPPRISPGRFRSCSSSHRSKSTYSPFDRAAAVALSDLSTMTPDQREQFKQAVFRCAPLPTDWPTDFAIITAYDPEGRAATPADNVAADAALEAELRSAGYRLHRITGGSEDGVHQEPGWGVPIGLPGAVEFGRRYRQLAIFAVRAGRLALLDCEDGSVEDLGRVFRAF